MPTNPNLFSNIVESPMTELLDENPVHFVSLPIVPFPVTIRFGPPAIGITPIAFVRGVKFVRAFVSAMSGRAEGASDNLNGGTRVGALLDSVRLSVAAIGACACAAAATRTVNNDIPQSRFAI